jgi:hypothetical protein
MAESTNPLVAFSDHAAQLVERTARSIVAVHSVAEGPRAESIGVPESSLPLKKFWSGRLSSRPDKGVLPTWRRTARDPSRCVQQVRLASGVQPRGADRLARRRLPDVAAPGCSRVGSYWDRCGVYDVEPIEGALVSGGSLSPCCS